MTASQDKLGLGELIAALGECRSISDYWNGRSERTMAQAAAALTSLIAERDGLALQVEAFGLTVDRCRRDASEAEAQLKAAREALEFYAEPTNYKGEFVPGGPTDYGTFTMSHHVNLVRRDAGTRARTALSLDTNKGDGV